jgi:hypothetical protein
MPSKAVDRVLAYLWALECNPRGNDQRGWDALCPAHEDRNPSFHLGEGDDGRALVYCHAGCTLEEIAAALHLDPADLFEPDPDRDDKPVKREVVERYDYVDEAGKLLFQVERMRPKGFRQRRPGPNGSWQYALGDVRRVMYRLPQVIEAVKAGKGVVVVEGERDVHTLEAKGQVATTCPGGAGKWREEYSVYLRGAKVAVIQDVDPVDPKTGKRHGQEHAEQVKRSLEAVGANVTMLQPAVGKDVTDHVKAGLKLGQLVPAGETRTERLQVLSAPEVMRLPEPNADGYLLGPLIFRGYRIVIGGHTGHGKTTLVMHMVASAVNGTDFLDSHWHGRGGLKALIVDVEQGTKSIKRVLREVGLESNPNVKYLRVPDGLALDTDEDAINFMEKTFLEGQFDVVVADPLYKLSRGDANDAQAATELCRRFDAWRDRFGWALLIPQHCRKPAARAALSPHDLFGSSAYLWGAEVVLGIERPQTAEDGAFSMFHMWKDRDGEIAETMPVNSRWGLMFDRLTGFHRAVKPKRLHSKDVIHGLLKQADRPLTAYELQDMWPADKAPKIRTIRDALESIPGCTHDGCAALMERRYQLPVAMFDE